MQPNGIALMSDGTFLVTHLGETEGGVYRMESSGVVSDFLLEVEGQPLPPTNYVHLDTNGRVWITVSTRQIPRQKAQHPNHADGFIVLVDSRGPEWLLMNWGTPTSVWWPLPVSVWRGEQRLCRIAAAQSCDRRRRLRNGSL